MRVSFVVDSGSFGGAHIWLWSVLRRLPDSVVPSLVLAEPIARLYDEFAEDADMVDVVPLAEGQRSSPEIERALGKQNPDRVFVNMINTSLNRTALAAAQSSCAITVAAVHLRAPEMTFDRDLRALYSGLYRVIAVSKPIEHQLAHSVLVRPSALFRVLNGVELPPNTVAPRPNVGKFNIGTVARLTAQKGVDVFLEAIRLAFGHRQDFVATVVGDGEDRQALERQAEGLPVSFVGYSDDIYGWLQNFDIFCLCSRDDALALALLEAIAAGVPAIASDVGDTRWALEDSVIIVRQPSTADKFAESILELLGSEPRRLELRGRGPKLAAERFSADRLASDVIDILIG